MYGAGLYTPCMEIAVLFVLHQVGMRSFTRQYRCLREDVTRQVRGYTECESIFGASLGSYIGTAASVKDQL